MHPFLIVEFQFDFNSKLELTGKTLYTDSISNDGQEINLFRYS